MTGRLSRKDKRLAFIDIGHGTLRMLVTKSDELEVSAYEAPCLGLAKGKITDLSSFSASIGQLLKSADISGDGLRVIVSVPTLHTRITRRTIEHRCSGHYRSTDYQSLHDAAIDSCTSELDEVVDVLLTQAWLDQKSIDPLSFGHQGRHLRAQALLATHPKTLLADIISCMNSVGLEVSEFRSGFFGLFRAVFALRPGIENAVLIDVGHSTTSGVMIIGGSAQQVFSVGAGSHHITKDLAVGLGVEAAEAELTKRQVGVSLEGGSSNFSKFIRPRVAELFALSLKHFAIYAKALDGGLMFCGGGSQLTGFSSFAEKAIGVSSPFICNLSNKSAAAFLDMKVTTNSTRIDSSWLAILAHARFRNEEEAVRRFERESGPLAKLRPLWTWLSELSR